MGFDEEYLQAFTPDGFMKGSGRPDECACCGAPTTWFLKALGLYFCSGDCHEKYAAWKPYKD